MLKGSRLFALAWRAIIKGRYFVLASVAAGSLIPQYHAGALSDADVFIYGGQALVGHIMGYHAGLHIYAQYPELQIGPGPLALAGGLVKAFGYHAGRDCWLALTMILGLIAVRALELTARHLGYTSEKAARAALLGGAAVMAAWSELAAWGHLEEAAVIALVLAAISAIAGGRSWWIPALLIGSAAMCKPWGVVAIPLLLTMPRHQLVRAAGVAVVAAAGPWIPFVVAAPHTVGALGSVPNLVSPHSALRAFGFQPGAGGPQSARTFVVAFGTALAALAALRGRWLAVPLIGLSARALLDPRWFPYYGVGCLAAALLWDIAQRRRFPCWTVLVGLLQFVAQLWLPASLGMVAQVLTFLAAAAGVFVFPGREHEYPPDSSVTATPLVPA